MLPVSPSEDTESKNPTRLEAQDGKRRWRPSPPFNLGPELETSCESPAEGLVVRGDPPENAKQHIDAGKDQRLHEFPPRWPPGTDRRIDE